MSELIFIISHLGSGSNIIYQKLNKCPSFKRVKNNILYKNSEEFCKLKLKKFTFFDHLLHDYQYSWKEGYNLAKFVYVICHPALAFQNSSEIISPNDWGRYYCYRLRRICQMAKNTPNAILLNGVQVICGKKMQLLNDFLKTNIYFENYLKPKQELLSIDNAKEIEESYERHLYFLKNTVNGYEN